LDYDIVPLDIIAGTGADRDHQSASHDGVGGTTAAAWLQPGGLQQHPQQATVML